MGMAADVIVIGLGAAGMASVLQLARRKIDVIGIDRFDPPHDHGSSHGGSRLTREAVGEGAAYVPLDRRSHAILAGLEAETGETLLVRSGMLVVGSPGGATPLHGHGDFLAATLALAERFAIPHERLDAIELRRRYPQFRRFRDTDRGYLEPQSGYVRPEAVIATQRRLGEQAGARIVTNTQVTAITQTGSSVTVATTGGTYTASRAVVSAGAWTRTLLGAPFDRLLTVTRQTLFWYDAPDFAPFAPDRFPTFIWFVTDRLEDYFTSFPVTNPAEGIKMVASREGPDIDPETMRRTVDPAEPRDFYERHVAPNLVGVAPRVIRAQTCLYTNTPDSHFIVDEHPDMDRVLVVSACSGHGFKHAPALGEAVAERLAVGRSGIDLAPFALTRSTLVS